MSGRKSSGQKGERRGEGKRSSRPPGKRNDPDYVQLTSYIRRETHKDVKVALLMEDKGREISELVEGLLAGWLRRRNPKR
jgi:hypothetical protein